MEGLTFSPAERLLLRLLRLSVGVPAVAASLPAAAHSPSAVGVNITYSPEVWQECHRLAEKHGVMALAWDGVTQLPRESQPPRNLALAWGAEVLRYEERYSRYCHTANELSDFYRSHGIALVQLKGVGLSTIYPVPKHREGGDIDIYTYSLDKSKMSDKEANSLADSLMEESGESVDRKHSKKHSIFHFKGIPVENHKNFLDVTQLRSASEVEKFLTPLLSPREVPLLDGECSVAVPSKEFNHLFVAYHAMRHFGSGLALHHLCDWACFVRAYGFLKAPEGIRSKHFLRWIDALDHLAWSLFGVRGDKAPEGAGSEAVQEISRTILSEVLHPRFAMAFEPKSKIHTILYKIRRMSYRISLRHRVAGDSVLSGVWNSITCHIREPETIFKTK